MGRSVTVAACALNQWAMDFQSNYQRIVHSIKLAKELGATLRVGTELEIPGYSCQDHFLEPDTFLHSWQILEEILRNDECRDILMSIGMPVMHRNVAYNCQIFVLNGKILLIRPKQCLCDDECYRESRWFVPWRKYRTIEDFFLPRIIRSITGQSTVPFGDAVISTLDTCIGCETCEELWAADSPHTAMGLDGVEIFVNSSGSYHIIRKAYYAIDLIMDATKKSGGIYVFSNQRGCDGDRLYYNGCACVALNGYMMAQGKQFSLSEVEVVTATLDLEDIRGYKQRIRSSQQQATLAPSYPRIEIDFALSGDEESYMKCPVTDPIEWIYHSPEEEIALGPACYLWDYLRRSGQGGYFLPLSGGRDSACVACIVYSMCRLICDAVKCEEDQVLTDVRRVIGDAQYCPAKPEELCSRLLFSSYLGTENSSVETKSRAVALAGEIGSSHSSVVIDAAVAAVVKIFELATGMVPRFRTHGGNQRQNLALQNVQARLRMVLSYFFAQLLLWTKGQDGGLLVLATANVDESLRGYMTKYDCSSGDINPIGSISKSDLNSFLYYCRDNFGLASLNDIMEAPPTAELEPLKDGMLVQTDEADMGMTYEELAIYGRLRRPDGCGPYSMFQKLVHRWADRCSPTEVADKVKHFFRCYSINRHKMTTLTPAYHMEQYSPDDHRHDHRPFLYNVQWPWQFRMIDELVKTMEESKN